VSTPTTTVPVQASLDDRGRLLHEDDGAAQLALAVTRLEGALATVGRTLAGLAEVEVRTTDRIALLGVLDVLTDRLAATGARPHTRIREVDRLDRPGQLVALAVRLTSPTPREGTLMTITQPTTSPAALAVREACPSCVVLPGDPGYDAARVPWNVAVDQRPAAVATPRSVEDVAAVVRAAAATGLRIAPQSSGHAAAPLADRLGSTVLLRLHELTGVTVDAEARTARVVGGTLWADVVAAAAPYGLTALHGSSPDVAVAGYTLGGGLSFYGRQHGLATNSVVALEVVTASGAVVRASESENAELFWALRGGGGSFGVVVAIELRLLPIADVFAGMLLWPLERAPEVVRAWARWTREVPETVTTSLRVMSFPPLPELPPFLSGRRIVVVDGAVLEDDHRAAELLGPLRALAPEMDTFARIPAAGLLAVHMDPPGPTPNVGDHAVLDALPDAAVDALLAEVGPGTTTSLMFAELRHLGGALGRPAAGAGALAKLPGMYALFCVAVAPFPEAAAVGAADARKVIDALAAFSGGRSILNFAERAGTDASTAFEDEAVVRLRAVKAEVDPAGVFQGNHEV
jgi:FAD/FMN-containing dehydrogenase/enamine deaminase RidA (YjgF/YER057c/UK114 family)